MALRCNGRGKALPSRLITAATHGPFCYVSVDLGDGHDIGAHSEDGVQRHRVPDDRGITKVSVAHLLARRLCYGEGAEWGIAFLYGEIGNNYGWCNILNTALRLLHIPYRVTRLNRYHCASLVTRYLGLVGAPPLRRVLRATPSHLAQRLGERTRYPLGPLSPRPRAGARTPQVCILTNRSSFGASVESGCGLGALHQQEDKQANNQRR